MLGLFSGRSISYRQYIVDGQTLNVETISGSTFTCNAIVDAVASCIEQAGGDPDTLFAAPQAPAAKAMAAGT